MLAHASLRSVCPSSDPMDSHVLRKTLTEARHLTRCPYFCCATTFTNGFWVQMHTLFISCCSSTRQPDLITKTFAGVSFVVSIDLVFLGWTFTIENEISSSLACLLVPGIKMTFTETSLVASHDFCSHIEKKKNQNPLFNTVLIYSNLWNKKPHKYKPF